MENDQYHSSSVLIFDINRPVRKQTRSVLNILGFWKIDETDDLEDARHALEARQIDLVLLAVAAEGDGVVSLVNDIRRFRCGVDPFLPVLLTTWDSRLPLVRPVIESGADDLLIHPFSTATMGQRIRILVRNRKPFVVTEDYLGPDRRDAEARGDDAGVVEVPNALRAKAEGRPDLAPNSNFIQETLTNLRRLKIRNIARKIWVLADLLKQSFGDPVVAAHFDAKLDEILVSASSFRKSLPHKDEAGLAQLCESLVQVVARLQGESPNEKSLELLEKSALALRVASQLENDASGAASEISNAMSRMGDSRASLVRAVVG